MTPSRIVTAVVPFGFYCLLAVCRLGHGMTTTQSLAQNPSAPLPPYPNSQVITALSWDLTTVASLRKAHGSDIWPTTWGPDGDLYTAWGDGGGFDGDSDHVGRVSLGFAHIRGTPVAGHPESYGGFNIWGAAPGYAQHRALFGGKIDDLLSVDGILYAQGGLWTAADCDCTDPTRKSGNNPSQRTLIWSADLGRTWTLASWHTAASLGGMLQYGRDYADAWDREHIYFYYQNDTRVDPTRVFLRRVRTSEMTVDAAMPGHFEYWAGVDAGGAPIWSMAQSQAVAIFRDRNIPAGSGAGPAAVYDPPLGRYFLVAFHGNLTGQVGLFEAPDPWGPWSTVAYYTDWGGFNEAAGEGNGMQLPAKWIAADGKGAWAVFSGVANGFDSFNVAKATFSVPGTLPRIIAPDADVEVALGETVTVTGAGPGLHWSVDLLNDGQPVLATASGNSVVFTVPGNDPSGGWVRVTLSNAQGRIYRDYRVTGGATDAGVTIASVATGKAYKLADARVGTHAYIDRPYTISALSPALMGHVLVQTANDDKFTTSSPALTLTLAGVRTVYVCYSALASELPAWLSDAGWSRTSERCDVDDGVSAPRLVYKRRSQGVVALGGNRAAPAAGSANYSNYVVIVSP
ncbi:MAG TPA: hypothetical protein VJQ47_18840 [Steroidobacteraceae bacterium]|nr:hypothetical protein [Steroidobacteraceae bacterium]